jgi:hypothetical protein
MLLSRAQRPLATASLVVRDEEAEELGGLKALGTREGLSSPGEQSSAPARYDGSRTLMFQPTSQLSRFRAPPMTVGYSQPRSAQIPVAVRFMVAITHFSGSPGMRAGHAGARS